MLPDMRPVALVLALLALAGCGEEPRPRATQAPSVEATQELPTPEPTSPLPPPTSCSDETVTGEPTVTVEAIDNEYSPDCLVVLGGQGLELVNGGSNPHTFTVEGTDLDLEVAPGAEPVRTEAIAGIVSPGSYAFFCRYHRTEGMEGELTVTDVG